MHPMPPDFILFALPPESLRALAQHYESLARQCRDRAEQMENRSRVCDQRRSRLKAIFDAGQVVQNYLAAGMAYGSALDAAAQATGFDAPALDLSYRKFVRKQEKTQRQARDRQIMQMALAGHTDAQIGHRFGLHPKSVNRIISAMRQTLHQLKAKAKDPPR